MDQFTSKMKMALKKKLDKYWEAKKKHILLELDSLDLEKDLESLIRRKRSENRQESAVKVSDNLMKSHGNYSGN